MVVHLQFVVPVLFIMIGIISFISVRVHLLSMLLSLEFILLNIFWLMMSWMMMMMKEMFLSLIFLTLTACEAGLGLSLMVSLMRSHGNDMYSSLSVMGW